MDSFASFLSRLFDHGRILFRSQAAPEPNADEVIDVLKRAYQRARRDLIGPKIPFDMVTALDAAGVMRSACWALVNRADRPSELLKELAIPRKPTTPSHHFSADLALQYLPQVCARARKISPSDALVVGLEDLLRDWPFSGVLAGLDEGPTVALDFGDHPGLLMLYAERYVQHGRAAWRPKGRGLEYVELAERDMAILNSRETRSVACPK
jgi:hypothetical protein